MGEEIKLRILTYNVHLMENSNLVVGAWVENMKPVVFQDEDRHYFIVNKINESSADIVALQEVWAKERMTRIQQDLEYPYRYAAAGADGDYMFNYIPEFLVSGVPSRAAGSGLVLLSKHPLYDVRWEIFPDPHDSEERAASKGVLMATVDFRGIPIRLGMTHAWTDAGGDDCSNISDLADWTVERQYPGMNIVMMGDFNIHRRGDPTKFAKINGIMNEKGAEDSWTLAHGSAIDGSETSDQAHNNLAQFFSPMRGTEPADCIDYVYVKSADEYPLKVVDAKVLKDWKLPASGKLPRWYWVHEGTVAGTPSATPFGANGEKLCVVNRETNNQLRASVCDRTTNKWRSVIIKDDNLPALAYGGPGVAWWNNTLHLFFRGSGNQVMKVESQDGINWSKPNYQQFNTSGGCCAIVFLGKLQVFVRHDNGNQISYYVWTSGGWDGPKWITLETDHNISAAVAGEQICVVVRDRGSYPGGIMNVRIDKDGHVSPVHQIAAYATTSGSPGVCETNGNFVVFYREKDGGGIFTRNSGQNWQLEEFTYHATNDEVCPITWGDKTLLFFSRPVWNTRKVVPGKISYPEDAVQYPERAFAHGYWPSDVELDASDHYPYQVDLVVST
jgi:endonuclease/exonuclease/phosphatase family metal-dependent hydrolase